MSRNQQVSNVEYLAGAIRGVFTAFAMSMLVGVAVIYLSVINVGLANLNTYSLILLGLTVACVAFNFLVRLTTRALEPIHHYMYVMYLLNIAIGLFCLGLTQDNAILGEIEQNGSGMANNLSERIPIMIQAVFTLLTITAFSHTIMSIVEAIKGKKVKKIQYPY